MFFVFFTLALCQVATSLPQAESTHQGKMLSVFNVVKFPNDQCDGGSSKNGTCYTESECKTRGGTSSGTCAGGYGVCCVFTLGCGGQSSENSTYFESSGTVNAGLCAATICKVNSDICQLRLDFNTFAISGPSTSTVVDAKLVGGNSAPGGVKDGTTRSRCLTDTFSVTSNAGNHNNVICGTNTNTHMYVEAADACNILAFQFGPNAVGISKVATRSWSIRVSQISCFDPNLPPQGCTQYFYGATTGEIQSYNYVSTDSQHLADQHQKICIRRERGNCRTCFYAAGKKDFQISGTKTKTGGVLKTSATTLCCGYGSALTKTSLGYDCLQLYGASKTAGTRLPSDRACGNNFGTATTATTGKTAKMLTVCTKQTPFMVEFISDSWEFASEMGLKGFKLSYFQDATGC